MGVRVGSAALAVALVLTTSSCGQRDGTVDDLEHALTEAHSAVVASRLALDLLDHRRVTRAVSETTLTDMARQVDDAAASLADVSVASSRDRIDRDRTAAAIHAGVLAVLDARDALADPDETVGSGDLETAGRQIDAELRTLRAGR